MRSSTSELQRACPCLPGPLPGLSPRIKSPPGTSHTDRANSPLSAYGANAWNDHRNPGLCLLCPPHLPDMGEHASWGAGQLPGPKLTHGGGGDLRPVQSLTDAMAGLASTGQWSRKRARARASSFSDSPWFNLPRKLRADCQEPKHQKCHSGDCGGSESHGHRLRVLLQSPR